MSENQNGKERKGEKGGSEGFECGVCLELMSWEKEARMLPSCAHSFCFSCLNKLFQHSSSPSPSSSSSSPSSSSSSSSSPSSSPSSSSSSSSSPSPSSSSPSSSCCFRSVKCPICREVSQCESVESLEMNFLIPEMISVLLSSNILSSSSAQEKSKCANFEVCGKQTQMFCPICNMFICDPCDSSHTSTIFTRNHKREQQNNINSLNERGLENLKKRECSKHPSELICGYCLECCAFVCLCCVLDPHVKHKEKVKTLEESALKKRDEVVEIGSGLKKRLKVIEGRRKKIEEEMKELEEKLEKKRIEMKEIELEKEDLRIRKDSIVRLSNTPSDVSLFDDQLFSTLLQTANEIVSEVGLLPKNSNPKKEVICCGRENFCFVSSFCLENEPKGVSVNSDGNIFVCEAGFPEYGLKVRDKEGNVIQPIQRTIDSLNLNPIDVSIGLNDQIVVLHTVVTYCSGHTYEVVRLTKKGKRIKSFGLQDSQGFPFSRFRFGSVKVGKAVVSTAFPFCVLPACCSGTTSSSILHRSSMEESTVVRVDEAVPRVPPVHNHERSPVITPSRVSNYQDSIRDSKSPSRDSESMEQNEKETEKSREKMEVDEEDKEGIKKLLRERAKEIRVELDLRLHRAFRTAFTRIGTEKNIIVGGFFFYNRSEEYPTAESIQKGLLEVLPDLEILPLENWPGTAMDGRNVVVKVEEWKTAWEVRKKILEVGGRLAEKWNRVFRWKDFLDHHLWSFEFIGAMGEWEPVNIIETLLVNRQFPSQGLKYLVRVRGSSCQRKVRLVYEDVPVLMIQMLSQERIARGVPVPAKQVQMKWDVTKVAGPLGEHEFCPDCEIIHNKRWVCMSEMLSERGSDTLLESLNLGGLDEETLKKIPFFEATEGKSFEPKEKSKKRKTDLNASSPRLSEAGGSGRARRVFSRLSTSNQSQKHQSMDSALFPSSAFSSSSPFPSPSSSSSSSASSSASSPPTGFSSTISNPQ